MPPLQTTALASFLAGTLLSPITYHALDLLHSALALVIHIIQTPFIS
jgi:hypothetical protein